MVEQGWFISQKGLPLIVDIMEFKANITVISHTMPNIVIYNTKFTEDFHLDVYFYKENRRQTEIQEKIRNCVKEKSNSKKYFYITL